MPLTPLTQRDEDHFGDRFALELRKLTSEPLGLLVLDAQSHGGPVVLAIAWDSRSLGPGRKCPAPATWTERLPDEGPGCQASRWLWLTAVSPPALTPDLTLRLWLTVESPPALTPT